MELRGSAKLIEAPTPLACETGLRWGHAAGQWLGAGLDPSSSLGAGEPKIGDCGYGVFFSPVRVDAQGGGAFAVFSSAEEEDI